MHRKMIRGNVNWKADKMKCSKSLNDNRSLLCAPLISYPVAYGFLQPYSHMDVWRLEASLVDVVEGEGLSGVGAVLVYLHCRPAASLGVRLTLWLLPPRCHDLWQSEGHGTGDWSTVGGGEQGVRLGSLAAYCFSLR